MVFSFLSILLYYSNRYNQLPESFHHTMQLLNATVILLTLVIFISSVIFFTKTRFTSNGALEAKEMREK